MIGTRPGAHSHAPLERTRPSATSHGHKYASGQTLDTLTPHERVELLLAVNAELLVHMLHVGRRMAPAIKGLRLIRRAHPRWF